MSDDPVREALLLAYDALWYLGEAQPGDGGALWIVEKDVDEDGNVSDAGVRPLDESDVRRARYAIAAIMEVLAGKR